MGEHILKGATKSKQYIDRDSLNPNGTINPFVNFNELLQYYFFNVYHQRSINLKAGLLSQVQETNLDKYLPSTEFINDFLYALCCDLEIYGNAFLEKAGTTTEYNLYHILGYQGRLDRDKNIYQLNSNDDAIKLDGYHLKYYSPSGKYYGQPDYLTVLRQINTLNQADTYNSSFFENGAKPGFGIIFENSAPNEKQQQAFNQFFSSNYKGFTNAHKSLLAYTGKSKEGTPPAKIRFEKLDSIEDMSFEKLKGVGRDEIIAAHGVPPRLAGVITAGQLGGGSELIDQLHAFNEITINPKKRKIERFFENIGIHLKLEDLDVTSFKDDSDLVTNLVDRNIISQVEARELLGMIKK